MRNIASFVILIGSLYLVACAPQPSAWSKAPVQIEVLGQGTEAVISAFVRTPEGRKEVLHTSGFVGRNGVGKSKQEGDGKTPAGIFAVEWAFGLAENPGTVVPYAKVTPGDVWVDDPASRYYNRWATDTLPVKDWHSAEILMEQPVAYAYGAIIEYNTTEVVRGAGSAIFLHCSIGIPTSGCISLPEKEMRALLLWLRPGTQIAIADSPEALRRLTR